MSFTPTSHRASETNASGLKLASVTVCAARMAQLRHRFPAYLCINFKGVSGKVVGHGFPLSPSYSDTPPKLVPDVCTLCRLALGPPDAPLALQVDRRPGSVQEQRYANALTTMRSACVLSTTFTLTPYGSAAFLARGARAHAWRARRLKKGRHWRRRRTLISYLTCNAHL